MTAILVVDDSRTIRLVVSELLGKLGYTDVDVAEDGPSALECLRNKQYGLILSDWEMQPMGGEEFLSQVRHDFRAAKTPVILMTDKSGRGAAWASGAKAFLAKPFGETELGNAIKVALR